MFPVHKTRLGLNPLVFSSISTPPLVRQDRLGVNDGFPAYAKLEVIIAYLTAHKSLNYTALEDFFVTYRQFTDAVTVWDLLSSRLLWAADLAARTGSENDIGHDIGTRTFVAIKHWLENYFEQDFVPNYALRKIAAETVVSLSGCTEFVLSKHFKRILSQIWYVFGRHLTMFWDLSIDAFKDEDYYVPMYGTEFPNVKPRAKFASNLISLSPSSDSVPALSLFSDVPIDADVGVSSIRISQQQRPKHKLSQMFKHDHSGKSRDVVLHDKVDFLAMSVVSEFYKHQNANLQDEMPGDINSEIGSETASVNTVILDHETSDEPEIREESNEVSENDVYASGERVGNELMPSTLHITEPEFNHVSIPDGDRTDVNKKCYSVNVPVVDPVLSSVDKASIDHSYTVPNLNSRFVYSDLRGLPESLPSLLPGSQPGSPIESQSSLMRLSMPNIEFPEQVGPPPSSLPPSQPNSQANSQINSRQTSFSHPVIPNEPTEDLGIEVEVNNSEVCIKITESESEEEYAEASDGMTTNLEFAEQPVNESSDLMDVHDDKDGFNGSDIVEAVYSVEVDSTGPQEASFHFAEFTEDFQRSVRSSAEPKADILTAMEHEIDDMEHDLDMEHETDDVDDAEHEMEHDMDHESDDADNADMREKLPSEPMPSPSLVNSLHNSFDQSFDAQPVYSDWDHVDMNNFDAVSYSGSSLTSISQASLARSSNAGSVYDGEESYARWLAMNQSSGNNPSISLLSEIDNSLLKPCAGYTDEDAERLKLIPDKKVEGDAITATLQELEGRGTEAPASVITNLMGIQPDQHLSYLSQSSQSVVIQNLNDMPAIPRSESGDLYTAAFEPVQPAQPVESVQSVQEPVNEPLQFQNQPHNRFAVRKAQSTAKLFDFLESEVSDLRISRAMSPASSKQAPLNTNLSKSALNDSQLTNTDRLSTSTLKKKSSGHLTFQIPANLHVDVPGCLHAPFILAYNSKDLAEQMTIVAKEMLLSVSAQDLVSLDKVPTLNPSISSWLTVTSVVPNPTNIELCVYRSQLITQWVQSEVLLCASPALQAQALCKFLHISFECLRLQNIATMADIMFGVETLKQRNLLKKDVFDLLRSQERDLCDRFLLLISSQHNYSALRSVHTNVETNRGSVPVLSLFLKDLAVNSEALSTNAEMEIHFDKYRVSARIARSVTALIRSGANYKLQMEKGALSKCLYISSLPLEYQPGVV